LRVLAEHDAATLGSNLAAGIDQLPLQRLGNVGVENRAFWAVRLKTDLIETNVRNERCRFSAGENGGGQQAKR
jgi:hypothetical protein